MTARFRTIGRDLQSRLRDFFDNPLGHDATPLELLQAALDDMERKVQPAGRGRRIFPYDRIRVRIAQPGVDAAAVEAIFGQFDTRLRDRFDEMKCDAPESIEVDVSVTGDVDEGQPILAVECSMAPGERPAPAHGAPPPPPRLAITVVKGQCAETEYAFEEAVVAIGRTSEPADALGQVRYNHVAFLEVRDGVTETVGRAHARLQFDAASGQYHLFNESSSNPTCVLRAGKMIRVAPRDPRGVRVQSGDRLQLGRAVLQLTIG